MVAACLIDNSKCGENYRKKKKNSPNIKLTKITMKMQNNYFYIKFSLLFFSFGILLLFFFFCLSLVLENLVMCNLQPSGCRVS